MRRLICWLIGHDHNTMFMRCLRCDPRPETMDEMCRRHDEYFSRPEVIERMRSIPPSFTYSRSTGKLTRIERD